MQRTQGGGPWPCKIVEPMGRSLGARMTLWSRISPTLDNTGSRVRKAFVVSSPWLWGCLLQQLGCADLYRAYMRVGDKIPFVGAEREIFGRGVSMRRWGGAS